ncbi:MAG: hypothetical protein GKR93_13520 [Gammaproteobacteria bacterium]|nr:hypothetical protein [Gammaproteobacteria bacterium]
MSIIQIMLSADFLTALFVYALLILLTLPCFHKIHRVLGNSVLEWGWEHIAAPLLRTLLMIVFISLSYPAIFGLSEAPAFSELLLDSDNRFTLLLNFLFLITLLFTLLPVIGERNELVLPIQAIVACSLLFSWLARAKGLTEIKYWPGMATIICISVLALVSYCLSIRLSYKFGEIVDRRFNVSDSAALTSQAFVLFAQSPAILLYSAALGRQLA